MHANPVTQNEGQARQSQKPRPLAHGGPICCQREMKEVIRRAILRSDGSLRFCAVWSCQRCGRLVL